MFSFQVTVGGNPRKGSVVSVPLPVGDTIKVVVMWDDDLSFQTVNVDDVKAVSAEEAPPNLVSFPGGENETAH